MRNQGLVATQIDTLNAKSFDLINIQSYFGDGDWGDYF